MVHIPEVEAVSPLPAVLAQSIRAVGSAARLAIEKKDLDPGVRTAISELIRAVENLSALAEGQGQEVEQLRGIIAAQTHRIQMAQELLNELEEAANKDELTGTWNRRALAQLGPRVFSRMERDGKPMSAIMFDLDLFKLVNDEISHSAGDFALKEFAEIVKKLSRLSDFLFRLGGEEFLLLVPETDVDGAVVLAERIRDHMENNPIIFDDGKKKHEIRLTLCAGVAGADFEKDSGHKDLQKRSDLAEKEAKKTRNTVIKITVNGSGHQEFANCSPEERFVPDAEDAQRRYALAKVNGNGSNGGIVH